MLEPGLKLKQGDLRAFLLTTMPLFPCTTLGISPLAFSSLGPVKAERNDSFLGVMRVGGNREVTEKISEASYFTKSFHML